MILVKSNSSIVAIGIDSVDVSRFNNWHTYSLQSLYKVFKKEEINYCLQSPAKSAERFAIRFAAKEAFFKAFSNILNKSMPFYTIARMITLKKQVTGAPLLDVDWTQLIPNQTALFKTYISITHTKTIATAFIIIEKTPKKRRKS